MLRLDWRPHDSQAMSIASGAFLLLFIPFTRADRQLLGPELANAMLKGDELRVHQCLLSSCNADQVVEPAHWRLE